jgi:hypothetical protein
MSLSPTERIALLKIFEQLPDDAIVSTKMTAAVLDQSERTVRRKPPTPRIKTSDKCGGQRAGDLRRLVRGELASQAAA